MATTAKPPVPDEVPAAAPGSVPDARPVKVVTEVRHIGDGFRVLARGKTGTLHRDRVSEAPPATFNDASIFRDLCGELGLAAADVVSLKIDGENVEIERVDTEAVARDAARAAERAAKLGAGRPAVESTK